MYNAAGRWMASVGLPAKSGVSGGIIGTLPGRLGIAAFSPKLDEAGNSVRAKRVFEYLDRDMGLHLMAPEKQGRGAVRSISIMKDDQASGGSQGKRTVIRLQGDIDFNACEKIWRTIQEHDFESENVTVDLEKVDEINSVGKRMIGEFQDRLVRNGMKIEIVDPDEVLA